MFWLWVERVGVSAAVLLPLAAAFGGRARRSWAGCVAPSWVAAGWALVVVVLVAARGPVSVSVVGGVGVVADPVSALVLTLVVGVGALVQSFSARHLQADPGAARFAARVGVVVAAMALVAVSGDLAGLVAGWVVAGWGFAAALSCRSDLPGVARCVGMVRRALAAGDACLVAAAVLIWIRVGDVRLDPVDVLAAARQLGAWQPVVVTLVVVAALARCAQGPFRRWLPSTVSAPTPASALLHAGVVNGGGVLLVRLGALGAWAPAMAGLLAVSGATAVWATMVMGRRADVKGQLAFSTSAQMAFMLAECAVGAYPAAVVHLVGHGFYKASLFFSSGSTVTRPGRPALPRTGTRAPLSAGAAAAAVAAVTIPGLLAGDGPVLAGFAAVTAVCLAGAFWSAAPARPGPGRWRWLAVMVAAAGGYGAVVAALGRFLAGAVATTGGTVSGWWLGGVAASAVAAARLAASSRWASAATARLLDAANPPPGWDRSTYDRRPETAAAAGIPAQPALEAAAA